MTSLLYCLESTSHLLFLKCTRIVASTYVFLGTSNSTKPPHTHIEEDKRISWGSYGWYFDPWPYGEWKSMFQGAKWSRDLALLESSILPKYKKIRFADIRSYVAIFIIGVQAIEYIISIIYRKTKSLSINPIKVVLGFPFSIMVIVQQKVYLPVNSINVVGFPFSILVIVQQKVLQMNPIKSLRVSL